jgi:hypothetical protein
MSNISWAQFGLFIAIATVLYYAVVLLFFFKNKLPVLNTTQKSNGYDDNNSFPSYKTNHEHEFNVENDFIEKRFVSKDEYITSVSDQDLTDYHDNILLNEIDTNTLTPTIDNALTTVQNSPVKSSPLPEEENNTVIEFPQKDMDNSIVPLTDSELANANNGSVDKPAIEDKIPAQEKLNSKNLENSIESIAPPVLTTTAAENKLSAKKKPLDKSKDSIMHLLKPTAKGGKQ